MWNTFFLLISAFNLPFSYAIWISSDSTLIRRDFSLAVGVYNRSVFLIGGYSYPNQVTEYRIDTQLFIDIGVNITEYPLTKYDHAFSQYWSQTEDIIFISALRDTSNGLSALYALSISNIPHTQYLPGEYNGPDFVGSCLASTSDQLFVSGADAAHTYIYNDFHILNLSSLNWTIYAHGMIINRAYHACVAYNDYLWVFGGMGGREYVWDRDPLQSNERVRTNINVNESYVWTYIDELSEATFGSRAIAWMRHIFIIGGRVGTSIWNTVSTDTVHIVDIDTMIVSVSPDKLVYPIAEHALVIFENVIYVFGGCTGTTCHGTNITNKWMRYTLNDTSSNFNDLIPTKLFNETPISDITTSNTLSNTVSTVRSSLYSSHFNQTFASVMNDEITSTSTVRKITILVVAIVVLLGVILLVYVLIMKKKQREQQIDEKNAVECVVNNAEDDADDLALQMTGADDKEYVASISDILDEKEDEDDDTDDMYIPQKTETTKRTETVNEAQGEGEHVEQMEGKDDDEIVEWLQGIGMAEYVPNFLKNGFDSLQSVMYIREDKSLGEMGIVLVAHKLKILAAIREMRNNKKVDGDGDLNKYATTNAIADV